MRDFEALGQAKAIQFLKQLPDLRETLRMDVVAAYEGYPAVKNTDEVTFCYPGLEAVTIYRLAHRLHLLDFPSHPANDDRVGTLRPVSISIRSRRSGMYFFIDHGTGVGDLEKRARLESTSSFTKASRLAH